MPAAAIGRRIKIKNPLLSVVIVSRNEGDNLKRTVAALLETSPSDGEILVVDDASMDGSADFARRATSGVRLIRTEGLGVTKARNRGAQHARGEVIVFADAHVEAPSGWAGPLLSPLARSSVGAVSPCVSVMGNPKTRGYGLKLKGPDLSTEWLRKQKSTPYRVPIVPGCFLAMRRDTFLRTGGFDPGLDTWGMSDIELSVRFSLLGYELLVAPQVDVPHLFRSKHPYQVRWESVIHNALRVAFVHFAASRTARVIDALRGRGEFPAALARLAKGDFAERRKSLSARRRHDDDWYFRTFAHDV